jgi:hypothetical protein
MMDFLWWLFTGIVGVIFLALLAMWLHTYA